MLIQRLANVPIAALAVFGVADEAAVNMAEQVQLPLLQLTTDVDIRDVDRELQRLLSDFDVQLERRAAQLALELGELSLAGRGLAAMVTLLAQRTSRTVAIFSMKNELIAYDGDTHIYQIVQDAQLQPGSATLAGYDTWAMALHAAEQLLGTIVIVGKGISESDRATVRRASMAFSLELTKSQAITVAEARFRGNLVEQILSGTLQDPLILQQRARELGFDVRIPYAACLFQAPTALLTTLQTIFADVIQRLQYHIPWIAHQQGVVCFLPLAKDGQFPLEMAHTLFDVLQKQLPLLRASLGRVARQPSEWQRSLHEAEQTIKLPSSGKHALVAYDTIGVYQLLLPLSAAPDTHTFYQRQLGALLEYDREQRGELLHTLEAYFDCAGNLARTAEHIHVHRNTLLYRLSRVAQICQVDLDDHEVRLSLWLALKLHHIYQSPSSSQ
jgi:purine catabolism regulator